MMWLVYIYMYAFYLGTAVHVTAHLLQTWAK